MSIIGKPQDHTLWKRRYRARLLREGDPARFYFRRHKRKLAQHREPKPFEMADLIARLATPDDLARRLGRHEPRT